MLENNYNQKKKYELATNTGIREALILLINGRYNHRNVIEVVELFTQVGKSIITRRKHLSYLISDWKEFQLELEDVVLDYIAPLFARDENGIFIELKNYFDFESELDIENQIYRLICSRIHKESIKTFEHRDPIGKVFYRSLRYVLSKHLNWIKYKDENGVVIISDSNEIGKGATQDEIADSLSLKFDGSTSLVKAIESCISTLIDGKKAIIVSELLSIIREQMIYSEGNSNNHSPDLDMTIDLHIERTINQIDLDILERYVDQKKLDAKEKLGFKKAIKSLLEDFQRDDSNASYYMYLAEELPSLDSEIIYQEKYRTRFEYVAKKAKHIFSASVIIDFKV